MASSKSVGIGRGNTLGARRLPFDWLPTPQLLNNYTDFKMPLPFVPWRLQATAFARLIFGKGQEVCLRYHVSKSAQRWIRPVPLPRRTVGRAQFVCGQSVNACMLVDRSLVKGRRACSISSVSPSLTTSHRCQRLNKECLQQESRRRSKVGSAKSRAADNARTARLEEKLDRVLASLKPGGEPISPSTTISPDLQPGIVSENANLQNRPAAAGPYDPESIPGEALTSFPATRPARVWKLANVTMEEAEGCLREFRNQHVWWIPFIYLPADMTAQRLLAERPFLWLNIVFIASQRTEQYRRMGEIVRKELAQAMVRSQSTSNDLSNEDHG
jgi:hypothetical protein